MKMRQLFLTNNNCYKTGKKYTVKGVMWHSTGANNPFLSRYVGPDDGILGRNKYNNHWNQPKPDGRNVCVHAFIGYTKDKNDIMIYQTLPWEHVGWHSGAGRLGSANTQGFVGFEICEDGLDDPIYFAAVYDQAVKLTAYLLKENNLPCNPNTVMDHAEGHRKGIASNHGDVAHWLKRHGKHMGIVRADIQKLMEVKPVSKPLPKETHPSPWAKESVDWAVKKGISDGTRPKDPITREEAMAMMHRTYAVIMRELSR